MIGQIRVDDDALSDLREAFSKAGSDYKENLAKLENLIYTITSGDITGDPATDLLNKYLAKVEKFQGIVKTIEEGEENMGIKKTKFADMVSNLHSNMR